MQVSAVLDVVAHGQPVLVVQLVIEFGNSVIVVFCFEDIQVFGSDAHCDLRRIQHSQVVGQEARIRWRFSPALPLVVHEQERSIFANGSARSPPNLFWGSGKALGRGMIRVRMTVVMVCQFLLTGPLNVFVPDYVIMFMMPPSVWHT